MTNEEFLKSISLDGEEWRPVKGFEDKYAVSNKSRVASFPRPHNHGWVLKPSVASHGYHYVSLYDKNGNHKYVGVHRIVAEVWLDNPNGYKFIDHIDGCRTNNDLSNIRWCSQLMNVNNPITKQRMSEALSGVPLYKKRKPVAQILDGKIIKVYDSPVSAAQQGYNYWSITHACKNGRKANGYQWRYLSDLNLNINDVKELLE